MATPLKMFRYLKPQEIQARISRVNKGGVALVLYKDARCDMNILDETVGQFGWQRKHYLINGTVYCDVGIKHGDDGWIWKSDCGSETQIESEKGAASDAFKRACTNWGIGRELYTSPDIFVPARNVNMTEAHGKPTTYDHFYVQRIAYHDDTIAALAIASRGKDKNGGNTGGIVFSWTCENWDSIKDDCVVFDLVDLL